MARTNIRSLQGIIYHVAKIGPLMVPTSILCLTMLLPQLFFLPAIKDIIK